MPRKRESRIYLKNGRYYGDFRDYADAGGKKEALIPEGAARATTDPDVANKLATDRIAKLEGRRRNRDLLGVEREATLGELAAEHLIAKAKAGKVVDQWMEETEAKLRSAIRFFGAGRDLRDISVRDLRRYGEHLAQQPNGRGGTLSAGTVRHYLNVLSNLYRRAQAEACVPAGFNPVASMLDKPTGQPEEARWLEVADAALLLEAARRYVPPPSVPAIPFLSPLVATFLLTGGRKGEVLGLAATDISFDRRTITFRPHPWRRLKTRTSHRVVPLWPQLEAILREHVYGGAVPRVSGLLFPSTHPPRKKDRPSGPRMIHDFDKSLDTLADRAGWPEGEIRSKAFRHTYCAARLQTLDRGAPVSPFTVARELGHGGRSLVDRVYGHLGDIRHRSETVEYRIEQHQEALRDRLKALG